MSKRTESLSKFGFNNPPDHSKFVLPSARAITAAERKRGDNLRRIEDILNQYALLRELDL